MPAPDKSTVIHRLRKLREQTEIFEKLKSSTFGRADFGIWRSEVHSWFQQGSPYTNGQRDQFSSVSFTPISYTASHQDREQRWRDGLKMAKHLIDRAIENLEREWATPNEDAGAAASSAPSVVFVNQNIQQNTLTIRTVLEEVAREIEEKAPDEGKGFRKAIEKIAQNPITKSILETAWDAAWKHISKS
jgi:hypothetical protein